jgi:hypothetical protein
LSATSREDESRVCQHHGAQRPATLQHIDLNLFKQETAATTGGEDKRLMAD